MDPKVLSIVVLGFAVKYMGYKFTILCKTRVLSHGGGDYLGKPDHLMPDCQEELPVI